ncbi:hypothetical protein Ssi03_58190 [Sphaerisporangium siamense]|nr:hypothetical protein Ssi03_58190 [Sphaerisporangium siamense]
MPGENQAAFVIRRFAEVPAYVGAGRRRSLAPGHPVTLYGPPAGGGSAGREVIDGDGADTVRVPWSGDDLPDSVLSWHMS